MWETSKLHGVPDLSFIIVNISNFMALSNANIAVTAVGWLVNGTFERGWKEDFVALF